jgi:hypothetical protein
MRLLLFVFWTVVGCRTDAKVPVDDVPNLVVHDVRLEIGGESIPMSVTIPQSYDQILTEANLIEWQVGRATVSIIGDSHEFYDDYDGSPCGGGENVTLAHLERPDGISSWCTNGKQSWEYRFASFHGHHLVCKAIQPGVVQVLGTRICASLQLPPADWKESLKPKTRTGVVVDASIEAVLELPSGYKMNLDVASAKQWARSSSRIDPWIRISTQAFPPDGEEDHRQRVCGRQEASWLVIRAREQLADGTLASCKLGKYAWIHRVIHTKGTQVFCDIVFDSEPSSEDLDNGLAICRSVELPATH